MSKSNLELAKEVLNRKFKDFKDAPVNGELCFLAAEVVDLQSKLTTLEAENERLEKELSDCKFHLDGEEYDGLQLIDANTKLQKQVNSHAGMRSRLQGVQIAIKNEWYKDALSMIEDLEQALNQDTERQANE